MSVVDGDPMRRTVHDENTMVRVKGMIPERSASSTKLSGRKLSAERQLPRARPGAERLGRNASPSVPKKRLANERAASSHGTGGPGSRIKQAWQRRTLLCQHARQQ